MKIKQLSIFIENKEGRLRNALEVLAKANINIRGLSIADNEKHGIIRLIVDDVEKANDALKSANFIVKETEVIVVGVPDKPNGLNSTLELLENNNINVEYIYSFLANEEKEAVIVMKLDKPEEGLKVLEDEGINILTKEDIINI